MPSTVKQTAVGMSLFLLVILLMFVMSSNSRELTDCNFNFNYSGRPVVYNFSRLSRQESWQITSGRYRASISVCHPLPIASQCQNSSVCVSGIQDTVWNVMISNTGPYLPSSQSKLNNPVLQLLGMQSCHGSKNYSAEFYFICSNVEQDPVLVHVIESCTLRVMWQTAAACPVDTSCEFNGISFTSLRHSDYYEVKAVNGQKFLLNLCGPVNSDVCSGTESATVCEVGENNTVRIIGLLRGYHVQMLQKKGIVLTYSNSSNGVKTEIQFLCNTSALDTNPKFIGMSGKTYSFEVETPLACNMWPQECKVLDNNGGLIDLSVLRKSNGSWVTQPLPTGALYHINVCGPLYLAHVPNCSDGAVGACRTDSSSSLSLGYISSGLRITETDTVILEYTGGSKCPSGGRYSMHIEFICARVVGVPVFVKETDDCVHHFSWETSASCPSLVSVGQNCLVKEQQYGTVFDLRVLHSPNGNYSLTTDQGDSYVINVCGALDETCNGKQASVCLTTKDKKSYAIGLVNSTVLYDNGGLRFVLHGEGCKSWKNSSTVVIILLCRQGSDMGRPEMFSRDEDCNFYYVWYTGAACPPHQFVDCSVMHDGKLYDLSPLSDLMSNHVVVVPQMNVKFLLNVCQSVVFGKFASCQYSSAACLVNMSNPNPTTRFINIGEVGDSPYFEGGKLKLKYNKGALCTHPEGPDHMSTVITFECDNTTSYAPEFLPGDVCVYEFLWRTQEACPVNVKTEQPNEDDSCTVVVPFTDNRVNLRSLRNKVKMVSDSEGYNYTFVVCGNLTSSHCGNSSVGVCQFKAQNSSYFNSAGVGNSHLHYSEGSIVLEYTDGDPCKNGLKRNTKIVFVCKLNGSEQVVFIDEQDSCNYLINWYTDLACNTQVECSTEVLADSPSINLMPLIRLDNNYKVQIGNDTVVYINVCRALLPVQGLSCPGGSSACISQLHNDSLTNEKSLGYAVRPVKGNNGKAFLMYALGSVCDSGFQYSSKFEFECDPKSGQGHPEFRNLTDDCQYQFIWKTSVTCEPFIKDFSVSDGQCVLSNEQVNASMDLKTLGQHGVLQVQGYSVNLCSMEADLRTGAGKSYGTLTSVVFDYQQQQIRLLFTRGAHCFSTEAHNLQLLLSCDRDASSNELRVVMERECGVVIECQNAAVCELLVPMTVHSVLHTEDTQSSSGLVVGLIVLVAVLCLLVLYFRKPANYKHFRCRVTSLFSARHSGQFHYSRDCDHGWTEV